MHTTTLKAIHKSSQYLNSTGKIQKSEIGGLFSSFIRPCVEHPPTCPFRTLLRNIYIPLIGHVTQVPL